MSTLSPPTITIGKTAVKPGEGFTALVTFNTPVDSLTTGMFALYNAANGQLAGGSGTVTRVTALKNDDDGKTNGVEYNTSSVLPYTRYWRVTITANADVDQAQIYLGANVTGVSNSGGPATADPTIYKSNSVFIDGVAPAISAAVAVGTRLTLVYSDAGSGLDATHQPAASAFRVTVDGTANAVTAVLVDTAANTVTLTLTNAVTSSQTVLVSYTDPTAQDDASAVQDRAGNDAASFTDRTVTVSADSTAPTMAANTPISFSKTSIKSGDTSTVTFTFSEAVRGFDLSDVEPSAKYTLSKLVAVNPTDGASTTWTAVLTGKPNVNNANDVTLTVNLTGVTDIAGNPGSGVATSQAITVDTRLPAIAAEGGIVISKTNLKAGESTEILFTFTANIDSSSFTADDVNRSAGWTVSNPVALNGGGGDTTFKATLTPPDDVGSASTTISVRQTGVTKYGEDGGDSCEGTSPETSAVIAHTARPKLVSSDIVMTDTDLQPGDESTVTFTFSETVKGFETSDVTVEHGTLENLHAVDDSGNAKTGANAGSSNKWSATLKPADGVSAATNKLTVNMAGVTNNDNNPGSGTVNSANYEVHTPRPTLTSVVFSDPVLTPGETSTVTFNFSEAVHGFDASDVTSPNGRLSDFKPVSTTDGSQVTGNNPGSSRWTATLRPDNGVQVAENKLTIDLTGVTNASGRPGVDSTYQTTTSYDVDTRPPTLADTGGIRFEKATLKAGDSTTVTFTFSEKVTGFTVSDVDGYAPNAELTDMQALGTDNNPISGSNPSSNVWRATLKAVDGKQSATNSLRVNLAGVTDAAGLVGADYSPASGNFIIDTIAPTVSSFTVVRSQTAGLIATYQVRLVFSEKVAGLAENKLLAGNNARIETDTLRTSDDGKTWTATLTAKPDVDEASNKVQLDLTNVTDAAGNAFASASAESDSFALDSLAPVFESAAVNGNQLVLHYTESSSLNAANKAAADAFAVRADGALNTVTAVTVDAEAKTVTLTLANSVAHGQSVTVAYTDPTPGDDANAIQDAAGNDAASLAAQTVTNNTPAPLPPQPAPDTDRDSVANNIEDQAPGLAGADTGDGNGDGIPDSRQPAVASSSFAIGPKGGDATSYATLVAGGQNGKPAADDGASTHITALLQQDTPANLPKALEMPMGLTSFNAELGANLTSENFSLYVAADLGINGYWMKNAEGTWVNLASEAYGGKTQTEGGKLRLDFKITDGGEFDADGQADGAITAPGAAAHMALSVLGQAPDAGHDGFWF